MNTGDSWFSACLCCGSRVSWCSGRMRSFFISCCFIWATFQLSNMQIHIPATEANCFEGDILLLLDSSGSLSNNEFSRLLYFSTSVLRIFSLGRNHVRVGLVQVSTNPKVEFGLDVYTDQESLQEALQGVQQLQGDTNTKEALVVAQQLLEAADRDVPKILLLLSDGARPGDVGQSLSEMKAGGVFVLAVSTVHGSNWLLRDAVSRLYVVDIDYIEIITKNVMDVITEIIQINRLQVVKLTPRRATLQWCPILTEATGSYLLQYNPVRNPAASTQLHLSGDSSSVELSSLIPDTTYKAVLHPKSTQRMFQAVSVTFSTPPECLSPAVVCVSDSGPHHIRVEWGPLQVAQVLRYTVEYGAIPSGCVNTVTLYCHQNFTFLTGLEPATQYLVTVSALCADGKKRTMSVRACTEDAAADLPALADLQLSPVPHRDLWQVTWQAPLQAPQGPLKGYWLTWERDKPVYSVSRPSALYLPPTSRAAHLPHLSASARVCVSPVYGSGRGDRICRSAEKPADDI